jgi:hypothetical protein
MLILGQLYTEIFGLFLYVVCNLGAQLLIHSHSARENYFSEVKLLNEANSKFKEGKCSTMNAQKQRARVHLLCLKFALFFISRKGWCSIYQHV